MPPCLKHCIKTQTDFRHNVRTAQTNIHVSLPLLLHRRWLARSVAYLLLLASYHRRLRSESANKIYQDYSKLPG